jgi:hypothetical protein
MFLQCREPVNMESIIIGKIYIPSHSHDNSHYDYDGNYVSDTDYHSTKYILVFRELDDVIEMEVRKNTYYGYEKGDKIQYVLHWYGRVVK